MENVPSMLQLKKTPKHVAFIMDGNLRWAKKQNLSSVDGLKQGIETMKPIVRRAKQYGIESVTFWALSTENWRKRGATFTNLIMDLMRKNLDDLDLFSEVISEGGKFHVLGDQSAFPQDIKEMLAQRLSEEPEKKLINVNIALNYGGRDEILQAVRKAMNEHISANELTQEKFSTYLYTNGQADPDLIVRTGFHQRLSGFLSWQAEYAELYFPPVLWPDFSIEEFDKALHFFSEEDRNFGGVSQGFQDYQTA